MCHAGAIRIEKLSKGHIFYQELITFDNFFNK